MKKQKSGTGKSCRDGVLLVELFQQFPDNDTVEKGLEFVRWGEEGPECSRCDSCERVSEVQRHRSMKWYCNACRIKFSVRTGMVFSHFKIPLQKWIIGMYLQSTNLKGVSSMKLHRDLDITHKSAWFMATACAGPWKVKQDYLASLLRWTTRTSASRRPISPHTRS